jgi:hypothetical protein
MKYNQAVDFAFYRDSLIQRDLWDADRFVSFKLDEHGIKRLVFPNGKVYIPTSDDIIADDWNVK